MELAKRVRDTVPVRCDAWRTALQVAHHREPVREEAAIGRRDRDGHRQAVAVEMLKEVRFPRLIGVAADAYTSEARDGEFAVDADTPHVVGAAAGESLNAA